MTNNTSDIHFVVETLEVKNGKRLKAIRPNSDGYFEKFPIAVLGIPSRNRTFYDVSTVVTPLTDPNSRINMTLTEGNLFGEWGHPYLDPVKPDLSRLMTILEKEQSHHFRKICTGEKLDNGGTILYADVKPCGPYGKYLEDQMMDPHINNSFSLRSICSQTIDRANNLIMRKVKHLITFDAVGAGGYAESSKRYVGSTENLSAPLTIDDFYEKNSGTVVACESITDKDILNIFGAKEMVVHRTSIGLGVPGDSVYLDTHGNKRSIMHAISGIKSHKVK